jgi:hypothetical protein
MTPMKAGATHLERFIRWFVVPLSTLKAIPNGDGAFVAMSIGCFLCERYYRSVTGTQDDYRKTDYIKAAAKDLKVDGPFFAAFWDIFRNGVQHQATPKAASRADGNANRVKHYKWRISSDYDAIPTRYFSRGFSVICLDPWKFAELMISKFLNEPSRLSEVSTHSFGDIWTKDKPRKRTYVNRRGRKPTR